jgi:PAS domain S-box-containing protein
MSKTNDENLIRDNTSILSNSESVYKLMVESVRDYAIFMLDTTGKILTWNIGAERIKGYKGEEIIGRHFSTFYLPQAIEDRFPEYELKKAKEEGRFEDEGWRLRKDGSTFWANVVITAIYNEQNIHIGFAKVTRDLSERKKLEEKLIRANKEMYESEVRSRLLIEGIRDYAIFMIGTDGLVTSWNIGAERITGYTSEQIIGRHFSVFYPPKAIADKFPEYELKKAKENGRFEDEGWRLRKDGSTFWANVLITPIYNEQNRLIGYSKITRDLTEKVRNEELMQKNKELHKINTDLDNFIYTASHDLKAPIANMQGLIAVLDKQLSLKASPTEKKILGLMNVSIENLTQTIANLTEITKVQKDVEQSAETISFTEILNQIKIDVEQQLLDSGAVLEENLQVQDIEFNRAYLRSILYNLLSNAMKFRSPARPLHITISTYAEDAYIILSVKDNGLGLTENQQAKLFSLFKRFHNHVEGSGIGLYMIKRIIENKNGHIEVASKPDVGTEFKVFFAKKHF